MLRVKRADLLKALNRLSGIAKRKSGAPVLCCAAIEATPETESCMVSGTDLDVWVSSPVQATAYEPISFLANHHLLSSLVRACPDSDIEVSRLEEDKLSIRSGSFSSTIKTHKDGTSSDLGAPEFKPDTACAVDVAALRNASVFSSEDLTRYYLSGVHLGRSNGSVSVTSTDGHRLYRTTTPSNKKTEINCIVSSSAIKQIIKHSKAGDRIEIELSSSHCRVDFGQSTLMARLIDGTFPDVDRIIPDGASDGIIRVDMAALASAAKRVSIGQHQSGLRIVKVAGNGSTAAISHDGMIFAGSDEIEAKTAGKPIAVGFNADYLADFAKVAPGPVEIQMRGNEGSPFVFDPESSDDTLILMPARF